MTKDDNTTLLILAAAGLGLYLLMKQGSATSQPQSTGTSMTIQVLDVHYDTLIPTALDFAVRTDKTGFVKVALDGSAVSGMERIPVTANTLISESIPNVNNTTEHRICVLEVV